MSGSVLGRHPGQGRGALPRGAARRGPRAGAGRRGARDRLGLARRLAGDRARGRRRACSRSRRAEFGHGRTRNLGAERTSRRADLLPHPGRHAAARLARRLRARRSRSPTTSARRSGRTCRGPDTSPMIARELTEFFAGFAPDGRPAVQRRATSRSSPTSTRATGARAGSRSASTTSPTPRTRRSGGRCSRPAGRRRLPPRRRRSCTRTTTRRSTFMRRYFDEYRGLRETLGPRRARSACARAPATCARSWPRDRRWMREQGCRTPAERARWTGRSPLHHAGRKVFSALGSRADRLPAPRPARDLARAPRRRAPADRAAADRPAVPGARPRRLRRRHARRCATGRRRCSQPVPGMAERRAAARRGRDPAFRRGSGGHSTIFNLLTRLEERGHTRHRSGCTTRSAARRTSGPRSSAATCASSSARSRARCSRASTSWYGADVVLATGWDTVYPVLQLDHVPRARLPGPGPRARVLRHLGARRSGPSRPTPTGSTASPPSPWLRDLRHDALRRPTPARSTSASTTTSTTRARSRAARHGRLLRARRHAAARACRSACWRCRSSTAGARTCASCCSATRAARPAVPATSTSASRRRRSCRGRTRRRPSGCRCR